MDQSPHGIKNVFSLIICTGVWRGVKTFTTHALRLLKLIYGALIKSSIVHSDQQFHDCTFYF